MLPIVASAELASDAYPYRKGYRPNPELNAAVPVATITDEMRAAAPASLDWSTQGATTPIKDQGNCGSCWAYSTSEGVESAVFMSTGRLVELSEQQVISCDDTDFGCFGGDIGRALNWVKDSSGGLATMKDYPDKSSTSGEDEDCKEDVQKVAHVTEVGYAIPACLPWDSCDNQKESDLMAALVTYGPLSVCVNAVDWSKKYHGGIFTDTCTHDGGDLDHCVQLVGYDTTGDQSYWKVRNSWKASWGENGFIRLPMGENACGIANNAMYVKATLSSETVAV